MQNMNELNVEMCLRGYHVYTGGYKKQLSTTSLSVQESHRIPRTATQQQLQKMAELWAHTQKNILPLLPFSKKTGSTTLEVWKFLAC